MFESWVPLVGGLMLLLAGGDVFVRGAVQVAERIGISPLVIALTFVAFGTSVPALMTSVQAGLSGSPGIAFGNVVGSNIANILLIVGVSALICPITIARSALRRDALVMLVVSAAFAVLALVLPMGRIVGICLIFLLVGYVWFVIGQETVNQDGGAIHDKSVALTGADPSIAPPHAEDDLLMPLLIALAGLTFVVGGGFFLVSGAVAIARNFEISETVIGLTIVAVATSTPVLITSVIAALKRQGDVAFGNVVGSNIYSILGAGGTTALITPSIVPQEIKQFDAPMMVAVSLLIVLFAATGLRIGRREGVILITGYVAYAWLLWL
ncbi:MAG: sodium:calcium antiporter [Roseovarius sp.]|nr:sodium:calcium antiporter [Roseovarius sp.]|tara:strand:+ start:264 stop:1238 length:975 start_codon:yes stop_codon:yes gene_type:complete